ncbi:MAG: PAS domain S-box protein [Pseudomonadota bacterium]
MDRADRFGKSQSSDGRYQLLVESIHDYAIYMLDPSGIVSSWNAGAQRFKGYTADEIVGEHFSRFYGEDDRAAGLPARALATAKSEGKFESEGWRIRKDGTRFWAHVVIDPVLGPDGALLGFAKITRDLTERKAAEADLLRSHEQFRLLVQSVTDYAIYMLDPQGNVANWKVGAQRIKGYSAEEIVGQHFSRFYTPRDRDAGMPVKALATAAREGRYEQEGLRVRKDGTAFHAHVVIDPIRSESGEIIGYAKITRDITERQLAQQQLEEAREALFQSQKMDAVGQLTGGVAHDFNNLLMAIMGSLEMAKKRGLADPAIARLIDNALQGAQRGANLTQRMLAFARRQPLNTKALDVAQLVTNMGELLRRSLGPSVELALDFPSNLPHVQADENQLELALLNLAVNARDAMPGGGTIRIGASRETVSGNHALTSGTYVRLWVSDDGEGMDENTLARAAEPFFTTKGVGKGTGLGLAMVHGMAAQSGGRLLIKSEKGIGTTAEIWLPLSEYLAAAQAEGEKAAEAAGPKALTVLAVDDDALVLFNTTAMLEDLGHTVVEAYSARDALTELAARKFDLVITDQAMPHMTGAQLVAEIRKTQPGLPVIVATGYAELPPGTVDDVQLLNKPFTENQLEAALRTLFAGR